MGPGGNIGTHMYVNLYVCVSVHTETQTLVGSRDVFMKGIEQPPPLRGNMTTTQRLVTRCLSVAPRCRTWHGGM